MRENVAEEKLRVVEIIKENAAIVLLISGLIWTLYSYVILPIKEVQFGLNDVLNNHIKTIEDEQIRATQERKEQMSVSKDNNDRLIRLEVILEKQFGAK